MHVYDCGESIPSSAASEDAVDLGEGDDFGNFHRLEGAVCQVLNGLGEDIAREGLKDTPKRVAKAWLAASEGLTQNVHSVLGGALFHESNSSATSESKMVLIRDVDFASTSESDLLPFFGRCHIAYIPRNGVVLGLSKVARLAKMFAKRFQEQQRFTCQILEAFNKEVQPLGCAAIVEAHHLGEKASSKRATSAALGCFSAEPDIYMQEFGLLLGRPDCCGLASPFEKHDIAIDCKTGSSQHMRENSSQAVDSSTPDRTAQQMVSAVESMLVEVGEDPERDGLRGSAGRYVQHLLASTSGRETSTTESVCIDRSHQLNKGNMQYVQCFEVQFASQCEHHLLPFHGSVLVAHIPSSQRLHLDQNFFRRIVNRFSKRLQIQERLSHQIGNALYSSLQSSGLLLVCKAAHMCMVARGVEQHASTTVTCVAFGELKDNHRFRARILHALQEQ